MTKKGRWRDSTACNSEEDVANVGALEAHQGTQPERATFLEIAPISERFLHVVSRCGRIHGKFIERSAEDADAFSVSATSGTFFGKSV